MSIFTALDVAVSGLQIQSTALDVFSQNVSNANTTGYKGSSTSFSDLIANDTVANYSPGGVKGSIVQQIDRQGAINGTTQPKDLAISGAGFFPVKATASATDPVVYTRSGSFTEDSKGNLVNGAGFYLQGWALDPATSALPPALTATNVDYGAGSAALVPVSVSGLTETAQPTTTMSIFANLKASETIYAGAYNATDPLNNMAAGTAVADFTLPVKTIDSTGVQHILTAGFLKTATNTWAVELYTQPASDVTTPNGQVASGTLTFNGDGTLATVSAGLQTFGVTWANGAANSSITASWGTAGPIFGTPGATIVGKSDGMRQFDSDYNIVNTIHNGYQAGNLLSVSIDAKGFVIGHFDNNTTKNFYQIPIAQFIAPNSLQGATGTIFTMTQKSGAPIFVKVGQIGGTQLITSALEGANIDQSSELANVLVAQRAYQASSKIVSTTDTMLQTLDTMLG